MTRGYVTEIVPGHIEVRCEHGNLIGSIDKDKYCDATRCKCAEDAKEFERMLNEDPEFSFLREPEDESNLEE